MKTANYWIEKLALRPHPEGGFFKETYQSSEKIAKEALPNRFSTDHLFSTAIFFLLNNDDFSAFHRIKQDELWHFYDGSSITIHIIDQNASYSVQKLGINLDIGERPQLSVKAGCFFAVELNNKTSYSLTGCTVAPGFDFADFEMPTRDKLIALLPTHKNLIENFTRLSISTK